MKWQFTPEEFHGQRSLVGYSPWGHKELDMAEQLTHIFTGGLGSLIFLAGYHTQSNKNRKGRKVKKERQILPWRENMSSVSPWVPVCPEGSVQEPDEKYGLCTFDTSSLTWAENNHRFCRWWTPCTKRATASLCWLNRWNKSKSFLFLIDPPSFPH